MKNTPALFIGLAVVVALILAVMYFMRPATAPDIYEQPEITQGEAGEGSDQITAEQQAEMADLDAELGTIDTNFDADLQKLDTELRGI